MSKILVLGGSGRTGKWVLQAALNQGYAVPALVRDASKIVAQPNLTIHQGDAGNPADLKRAAAGCEAAIQVLNISRTSDIPWAPLRTPKNFLSKVMQQLIQLENGPKRIVCCSAWGVGNSEPDIPGWFRFFIRNSNIGVAYRDHDRQEQVLHQSNLQWTIVRPVGLTNTKAVQSVRESFKNHPKPTLTISRKTLGTYLVDCLKREDLIGKTVAVSKDP